ncbi:MAG: hypothetical protein GY785_08440 [Gammaproteobacteria bacterium]|nr:hypothetical protein [Gammaproteobacteria bacterium]
MSEQPVFNDNVQLTAYVDRLGGGGLCHQNSRYHFRNRHTAFSGTFELLPSAASVLEIRRRHEEAVAELAVNLEDHSFVVRSRRDGETREARTFDELCTLLE